jgi:pimeloyl-ACP methyl ester carboxylesterase
VPLPARLQGHDLMQVLYLHGFASSPHSSKATFLAQKLAARGVTMMVPDLNEPDFSTLTVSRMLGQVSELVGSGTGPISVVGSSLGGFVAVQAARQHPDRVSRLVLLAPALDFDGKRLSDLGDRGLEAWKSSNQLAVFHYGYGRTMSVHYDLYADARQYNAFETTLTQPVQIFQGRLDTAVEPRTVERWAASRSNVELHMLDDDHQLLKSLELIWTEMEEFLFTNSPITNRFPDTVPGSPPDRS